jgi:hypothetical protein
MNFVSGRKEYGVRSSVFQRGPVVFKERIWSEVVGDCIFRHRSRKNDFRHLPLTSDSIDSFSSCRSCTSPAAAYSAHTCTPPCSGHHSSPHRPPDFPNPAINQDVRISVAIPGSCILPTNVMLLHAKLYMASEHLMLYCTNIIWLSCCRQTLLAKLIYSCRAHQGVSL